MVEPCSSPRVLVVDDESGARSALSELLRDEGYEVRSAADGYKALGVMGQWTPDVILTDVKMPGLDGIGLMQRARELEPELGIVVMTAFGSVEAAVDAMKQGADDYLTKPLNFDHVQMTVKRCLDHRALQREASRLRQLLEQEKASDLDLIGETPIFRKMLRIVEQIADSEIHVLISGEHGSGGDRVATTIHARSGRRGPLVRIACEGLPPALQRAELFGRPDLDGDKGVTAGLTRAREGTLVLEDVHALDPSLQAELAQALDAGTYVDAATGETHPLQARIISISPKDLREAPEGQFREDLYFQLSIVNLRVPSLRERTSDIPLIATRYVADEVRRRGAAIRGIDERALGVLMNYDWPGNLAELESSLRHALALATGAEISPRDLPAHIFRPTGGDELPPIPGSSLYEIERYAIRRTLEEVGGSTSKAAKILGISPRKIQYRLREYSEQE